MGNKHRGPRETLYVNSSFVLAVIAMLKLKKVEDPTVEGLSTIVSYLMRIDVVFSTGTGHSAIIDI